MEQETCYYCGDPTIPAESGWSHPPGFRHPNMRTRDHTISRKYRQSNQVYPVVIACNWCNSQKGARLVQDWVNVLRSRERGYYPKAWTELDIAKARKVLARYGEGKIKKVKPSEKPHALTLKKNGLFACSCGVVSGTTPCYTQISAVEQ